MSIAFIGNFETELPSPSMVDAALRFFDDALALGKLTEDYKIHARQDFSSAGPGNAFMNIIRLWPRYSATFD